MNFATENKEENIKVAERIIVSSGITENIRFVAYSDTNGVSVYFKTDNDIKIRVSDHSVTNFSRLQNEVHLSFDRHTIGIGGKKGVKNNSEINKLMAKKITDNYYSIGGL